MILVLVQFIFRFLGIIGNLNDKRVFISNIGLVYDKNVQCFKLYSLRQYTEYPLQGKKKNANYDEKNLSKKKMYDD